MNHTDFRHWHSGPGANHEHCQNPDCNALVTWYVVRPTECPYCLAPLPEPGTPTREQLPHDTDS